MRKIIFTNKDMKIEEKYQHLVYDVTNLVNKNTNTEMTVTGEVATKTFKDDEALKTRLSNSLIKELTPLLKEYKTIIIVGENSIEDIFPLLSKTLIKYRYRIYQYDNNVKYNSKVTMTDSVGFALDTYWSDFNHYSKIHHIGDIHGCYTVLRDYISMDKLPEDELFIFTGDLLERGIENMEVLNFLLAIYKLPNVKVLEGNHETHLANAVFEANKTSREVTNTIMPLIEEAKIKKSTLKDFLKNLMPFLTYEKGSKRVLVTHGGLTSVPDCLGGLPLAITTRGVGDYNTPVETMFTANMMKFETENKDGFEYYQVHGHRNNYHNPVKNMRTFNLEGKVEFGGHLRTVVLENEEFTTFEVENKVFNTNKDVLQPDFIDKRTTVEGIVKIFRSNDMIKEVNTVGDICSYNFKKEVFYNGLWNQQVNHARGMHINTATNQIVVRGFDKFFNSQEETNLSNKVTYPAIAYTKLNGYLALCGLNEDEFYFATKSVVDSDLALLFADIFKNTFDAEKQDYIKNFLKTHNCSLAFESISPVSDAHVIQYGTEKLVLLNIVKNEVIFDTLDWDLVMEFAETVGVELAEVDAIIHDKQQLNDYMLKAVEENIFDLDTTHLEGYVIKFDNNYMTKLKLPFYLYWKNIRQSVEKLTNKKTKAVNTGNIFNPTTEEIGRNHFQNVNKETSEILNLAYKMYVEKDLSFDVIEFMNTKELKELVKNYAPSNELLFKASLTID